MLLQTGTWFYYLYFVLVASWPSEEPTWVGSLGLMCSNLITGPVLTSFICVACLFVYFLWYTYLFLLCILYNLTIFEILQRHQCPYLFKWVEEPWGQDVEYANPNDQGLGNNIQNFVLA